MTSNNATITVNVTAANTRTLTMDGWLITFAPSDMMSRNNGAGLAVSESSVYTSTSPSVVTFTQESYNASSIISIVSESLTNVTQSTFTGVSKTIDQVTPGNGGGAVFSGQSFNLGTAADTVFTTQTVTSSNATYDGGELLYLGTTLLGQPPLGGHLVIDANPATSGTMEVFTLTQTPIIAGQGAPTLITQSAPSLVTQTIPVVSTPVSSTVLLQAALAAPTQTNLAGRLDRNFGRTEHRADPNCPGGFNARGRGYIAAGFRPSFNVYCAGNFNAGIVDAFFARNIGIHAHAVRASAKLSTSPRPPIVLRIRVPRVPLFR